MQNGHSDVQFAGFARRAVAIVIDTLLLTLISSALLAAIFGLDYLSNLHQNNALAKADWRANSLEQLLSALWFIGFWAWWKATPGKLLLDCQVVDAETLQKPTLTRLIVRYFAYLLSLLPGGLGFLWVLFDRRNQGWHDKLAKTLVIMQDDSLHIAHHSQQRQP